MLGRDYPGYFRVGDAKGLARLIARAERDDDFRVSLERACRKRRALFRPESEARAVNALVARLLQATR
jgi:hypothetical protein